MHMHPSGKPEVVQPTIGFYFTDRGPTNVPFRVALKCFELDIPAGADNYAVEQSYLLPVDANILRVSTHAHYLGREMQGYAILPTGEKKWLIWIKNWDFNWQGDYEYSRPQFLPKGSRLVMRYTYDNSTNNVRNPNQPPKRVRYGLETTDEMGELWFQVVVRSQGERGLLAKNYFAYLVGVTIDFDRFRLRLDPGNVAAHTRLGRTLHAMGRFPDAMNHLISAVRIRPGDDRAHYELALLYLTLEKWPEAEQEFLTVTRLNPDDYQAHGNLGDLYRRMGRTEAARGCFETALRLNPDDPVARRYLGLP
jgi:tetratricopeptide (TPR) repeat protein